MPAAAGKFDQRVTLLSRSGSADAVGQITPVWTQVATVWAERVTQRSAEAVAAAQVYDDHLVELRIRYRTDVQTTWRLEWGGVGYDIVTVEPYGGRKDRLRLLCRRGVKDGR